MYHSRRVSASSSLYCGHKPRIWLHFRRTFQLPSTTGTLEYLDILPNLLAFNHLRHSIECETHWAPRSSSGWSCPSPYHRRGRSSSRICQVWTSRGCLAFDNLWVRRSAVWETRTRTLACYFEWIHSRTLDHRSASRRISAERETDQLPDFDKVAAAGWARTVSPWLASRRLGRFPGSAAGCVSPAAGRAGCMPGCPRRAGHRFWPASRFRVRLAKLHGARSSGRAEGGIWGPWMLAVIFESPWLLTESSWGPSGVRWHPSFLCRPSYFPSSRRWAASTERPVVWFLKCWETSLATTGKIGCRTYRLQMSNRGSSVTIEKLEADYSWLRWGSRCMIDR